MATPVPCSYSDCKKTFETEKQMRLHKKSDHDYCKRCDYDAEDWEDLLQHKIDSMTPFVLGEKKDDKKKLVPHIVCEFCGEEFKSFGGRLRHRTQMHQAEQEIECPAKGEVWDDVAKAWVVQDCGQVFLRPSELVAHYEQGLCMFTTRRQFLDMRHQKHILKQIMADPDVFTSILNESKLIREWSGAKSNLGIDDDDDDDEDEETGSIQAGGVKLDVDPANLLDLHDVEQSRGPDAIIPRSELNVMDLNVPMSAHDSSSLSLTAKENAITSRLGALSITSSSRSDSQAMSSKGSDSASTITAGDSTKPSRGTPRWRDQTVSLGDYVPHHVLAPSNEEMPSRTQQAAIEASAAYSRQQDTRTNLFHSRFWDPSSADYHSDLFYNPVIQKYTCPFPGCSGGYSQLENMEHHLRTAHMRRQDAADNRCPACLTMYLTIAELVRHFEGSERGGRCHIARYENYTEILNEVTGGFVCATRVSEEEVCGVRARYVKSGGQRVLALVKVRRDGYKRGPGVMRTRYEGQVPDGSSR